MRIKIQIKINQMTTTNFLLNDEIEKKNQFNKKKKKTIKKIMIKLKK